MKTWLKDAKNYPLVITVPFLLVSVIFILGITFGIPLGDEWVWTKQLLLPLSRGEISFSRYILGEYSFLSHSHYLALLFLLADFHWLGLDFSYFTYVGIIFYVLGYLVLLFYIKQFLQGDIWVDSSAVVIMSVGYFCLTSDFPWLLVVFEYVYFFLAIALLIVLDKFLRQQASFLCLLGMMFVSLLFGDTIGMSAVFVCAAALFVSALLERKNSKYAAVLLVLLVGFFASQHFLVGSGVAVGRHSRIEVVHAVLKAPADVLISFMSIFSQPLIDITIFRYGVGEKSAPLLQFGLGVLGFVFVCSILFSYFYYKGWKKSWLPVLFIIYGCLSWLLIFISRYLDLGVHVIDEPRYVRLLTLVYVGAGSALLCINLQPLARRFYVFSAIILLIFYVAVVRYKFWQDQYIESYFVNAKIELQKEVIDSAALSSYIGRCADGYCDSSIEYMKQHHLSIFKESQAR